MCPSGTQGDTLATQPRRLCKSCDAASSARFIYSFNLAPPPTRKQYLLHGIKWHIV